MHIHRHHFLLLFFLAAVAVIRFVPGAGEFYALILYPSISSFLSGISSSVSVSLDEIVALVGIFLLIMTLIIGVKKAWKGWKIVGRIGELVCWYVVWFYLGWGCNYFRDDFYIRMSVSPVEAEKESFLRFATDYAAELNEAWSEVYLQEDDSVQYNDSLQPLPVFTIDKPQVIAEIKKLYHSVPPTSGLCSPKDYLQPKEMLLNRMYSAAGVMGFMGPWMGENLLNADLFPVEFPSVYAHELSHMLGVSSEAEANYWAYYICTKSAVPEIRYSGYLELLLYVLSNAKAILSEAEYETYFNSIRPEIIAERRAVSEHWQSLRIEAVDKCQNLLLDLQLKSNKIPSGTINYHQVVRMIISVRENTKK